jgi:hypothetical protein
LPICDEFVIAVGNSDDGTREAIESINSPKIKIIDTIWDENLRVGGKILAQQTDIALGHCTGDWCFYIQGDEVIHEKYLDTILNAMKTYLPNQEVEGLLFKYLHFYGNYNYVGIARKWYRHEIRIIRNNKQIQSYRDAQGFRTNGKKLAVKLIDAEVYHYGWCRPPKEQALKQVAFNRLYNPNYNEKPKETFLYTSDKPLKKFEGTHPAVIKERIANTNWEFEYDPSKTKISIKDRFILWFESLTGYRLWEYKNYKII